MSAGEVISAADRAVERLENVLLGFAKVSLLAMMILISYNTVSRYLFNSPVTGVYTVVEAFLMFITFYWTISFVERVDGHVRVDIISRRFSSTVQQLTTVSYLLLTAIVILWIDVLTIQKTIELWARGSATQGIIQYPVFLSWIILPIGFTLLLARLLVKASTEIMDGGTEPPEDSESEKI